jgi:beta-galactosidase
MTAGKNSAIRNRRQMKDHRLKINTNFRNIFLSFVLLPVFVATGLAQSRITSSFDNDWLFCIGDEGGVEKPEYVDSGWRKLNVPHDWSIEGPFDAKNPTAGPGGFLPSGVGWYRKHFTVPAHQSGKRVFVEFDGVMANSEVWVNGVAVGGRPYGYVSFGVDLTPNIKFGRDNVIAVRADNSGQPASRWYTGAGIYRHVRLVVKDGIYLENGGTFVSTPSVGDKETTVKVSAEVNNRSGAGGNVRLEIKLLDAAGKTVAKGETAEKAVPTGNITTFEHELNVKNAKRWNLETPYLYKAMVKIVSRGKTIDDDAVPFGIRHFEFVPATGFWLNGKNFKIKGACLHHDGSAFGAAVPLAVWEKRLNELGKLGVNAIRTAHNPVDPEFLDLTDRMGFIVMDELFDQWTLAKNPFDYHKDFNEWSKIDIRDTVRRDRNHPSVVIYSAGNEIRDTPQPELAKRVLRGLVDAFHENDTTRPVTQALFRPNVSKDYDNGLADMLDVVGQNYREKEILAAYKQNPKRKILGTENTHDLNQWVAMRDNPEYSGQFIWVGVDYLGESMKWPNYAYGKGLLERIATPRPTGYQRQSWWSEKPMVYIARRIAPPEQSPTDPGYEIAEQRRTQVLFGDWTPKNLGAHKENVEIYSNCEEVELFLNGRSLGAKTKPADDSPRNWNVDFEAGTIKAMGKNGGKTVAEFELKTAGKPAKILLSADKARIANNWDDVVFVTATVVDANGIIVPNASDMIEFGASGPGRIAAVDSADNADHDPFQATKRRAYNGRCVAYIKANSSSGKVMVTAKSGSLAGNAVTISVGK